MIWTILMLVLVLWLLGVLGQIGGGLIHLLLIVALILLIIGLLPPRED